MADGPPVRWLRFRRVASTGIVEPIERPVADETPVAIEYNGLGYAVLMASATDLEDLAFGFSRAERLIERAGQIVDVDTHRTERGMLVRITLSEDRLALVADRVRHRVSESSCGLCGIENLEQALRPLPEVEAGPPPPDSAIFAALAGLSAHQPLNAATGGVHAAALCGRDGSIRLAREDVGRHNGFDKLIGAMLRQGLDWDGGFALLTSRCSYELVEKAALAGCPTLVTVSAPTGLAIDRARGAGLRLIVLARPDAMLVAP
ncbi:MULTISPECIES: formate dehydrogenase accessory sulfurtransferase FdhD [unclassified Sphingomonas]|uniref:formate dehydrogenase accessory sulfurtransferase FdhD n=1 Tax=unclassified Sphingomonas TaxID=196159 RepID=UPI0006FA4D8E|nr:MULTISPECIES: formate dehydrogenase accessory sulfurtransferase FdhD [unclassified Sphingomonas]KQX26284.1 formate dehydrogenase family accessory protein FdhD [Sphingomonas sp. Root1294]KQY69354.1 formate dehydrogenase family accessory protein FdhD [Sphingomonas sp. Root50]KRB89613.1 formate dehydrogenase family accessory protein FdhD [Sphingomonas sp. Root720]